MRSATRSLRTVVKSEETSGGSCRPLIKLSSCWYCCDGKDFDVNNSTSQLVCLRAAEAEMRRWAAAAARELGCGLVACDIWWVFGAATSRTEAEGFRLRRALHAKNRAVLS